jgi:ABC-type transport system involved in cytochrome bd biosynthesis fused ATPase/permease subunit
MTTKISLQLKNIDYIYPHTKIPVFENLNLQLEFDSTKKSNLVGIIGPSGVGKTSLISIIGGQLNPQQGNVFINEVDIYQMYDEDRRKLLAYQMQTATNLRGNVRTNLIFGIFQNAHNNNLDDEELIKLLSRVGLWSIFEEKDGLETIIGEGGLNLSGGQRQRLNFAALYLRTKFYKPLVVLIDEPTSSLDEISENAITSMINELAIDRIVLVVAHRLVTLKQAIGLLDLSILQYNNYQLELMNVKQLEKESEYYRQLINHKVELD